MKLFWTLYGIDALIAAIFVFFFLWGLEDGTVSSFNIVLWLGTLGALAGILGGGWILQSKGLRWPAIGLLSVLAIPGFLVGLFFLALIILQPRWN